MRTVKARPQRLVALGASNLTRGLPALVSVARDLWGPGIEVFAVLGHGRSFGEPTRVFLRTLPGILQSGLWSQLEQQVPAPTVGLITDVGNDLVYETSVQQTLGWVEECARRLRPVAEDIVLTDLPLSTVGGLTKPRFLLFRTLWFPRCRLSLEQVLAAARRLSEGLAELAERQSLRLVRLKAEWYGFDPIHIRFRHMRRAWREMLCGETGVTASGGSSLLEGARLYLLPPERRRLLGCERFTPQHGYVLPGGGRIWLY